MCAARRLIPAVPPNPTNVRVRRWNLKHRRKDLMLVLHRPVEAAAISGHQLSPQQTATPSPERTFKLGENLDFKNSTLRGYKAVAKIILIKAEQFRISLRPCTGVQVARKLFQRRRNVVHRPEARNGGPDFRIEICRRSSPIGTQETVGTVIRYRNGRSLHRPKPIFKICHPWHLHLVQLHKLWNIVGKPEPSMQRVEC